MNQEIEHALQNDRLVDITTVGRKTGESHRIEIAFHYIDQAIYISGLPGKRDWYANMLANPDMTFHLKQSVTADIPARALPILDEDQRRVILTPIVAKWDRQDELEAFVKDSPLVIVQLQDGQQ